MFTAHRQHRQRDRRVIHNFFFQRDVRLLHPWRHEIRRKRRNFVSDPLRESSRQRAICRVQRTIDERIGIRRKYLVVVVIAGAQEEIGVGDSVFRLDDRVVDLRNADIEDAVSRARDQRSLVPKGIRQPRTGGKIVRLERNFSRWWK